MMNMQFLANAQPFQPGMPADIQGDNNTGEETKDPQSEEKKDEQGSQPVDLQEQMQQALMAANLCLKHFPEPIIYVSANNPVCRKCIPEFMEKQMRQKRKSASKDQPEEAPMPLSFMWQD